EAQPGPTGPLAPVLPGPPDGGVRPGRRRRPRGRNHAQGKTDAGRPAVDLAGVARSGAADRAPSGCPAGPARHGRRRQPGVTGPGERAGPHHGPLKLLSRLYWRMREIDPVVAVLSRLRRRLLLARLRVVALWYRAAVDASVSPSARLGQRLR